MSIKKRVVRGVKWTAVRTIVLAFVAILKISILTRFLDKADFGLIALVTFVMGFMELFNDMGITTAILHKQNITKNEYASLYWLNVFISFIMYGVLLGITPLVTHFYQQEQLNILIPLLGLNLLISAIGKQFKIIEQKKLLFKGISLIDIISAILSLIIATILAVRDYGVFSLVYSALFQFLFSNLCFFIMGYKRYGLLFHYRFEETRPFLKIGVYQVGSQSVNFFNRDLDVLLIGKFFSAEVLGGYSLARELVRKPIAIINPILNKVGAPALAGFNHDRIKLKEYYLKLVNIVASLTIPLYIVIALFAPLIVQVLYGPSFKEIVVIVQILSVSMIFRNIGGVVGNLVVATGRTDLDFRWNLITLIVTPVFVLIGSQYSIEWVAIFVTVSSIVLYVPSWYFYIRKLLGASLLEYSKAFFIIKRIKF